MTPTDSDRIRALERSVHRHQRITVILGVVAALVATVGFRQQAPNVIRVRGVVVVDEQGRERIFIGAPVPDPKEGRRIAPSTGLAINDTAGVERAAWGLFPDGRVVLGLDAPPGKGDDRNRERVTLVADADGGGYLRLLGKDTWTKALLRLDDDGRAYLDFLEFPAGQIRQRRLGIQGDTVIVRTR